MKNKSFTNFLIESSIQPSLRGKGMTRPVEIDAEQAVNWVKKHAMDVASMMRKHSLSVFRGSTYDIDMGLLDSSSWSRGSANTLNTYTAFLDGHPAWKDYPKRSQSIICTTSSGAAQGYVTSRSSVYAVIPSDSCKSAFCQAPDFWYAFPNVQKLTKNKMWSLDELVIETFVFCKQLIKRVGLDISLDKIGHSRSFDDVSGELKKVTVEHAKQLLKSGYKSDFSSSFDVLLSAFLESEVQHDVDNLFEFYELLFKPQDSLVQLGSSPSKAIELALSSSPESEIWFSGEVLVVRREIINDLFESPNESEFELAELLFGGKDK